MNNSVNILRHGDDVKSVGFGRICTNNCTLILDSATIEIQYTDSAKVLDHVKLEKDGLHAQLWALLDWVSHSQKMVHGM
jgi:hypothetical protein